MKALITLPFGVVSVEEVQTVLMCQTTPDREAKVLEELFWDIFRRNPHLASTTLQRIQAELFGVLIDRSASRRLPNPASLRPDVVLDPS